jgi:hypothetical protein
MARSKIDIPESFLRSVRRIFAGNIVEGRPRPGSGRIEVVGSRPAERQLTNTHCPFWVAPFV